jgi:hypothetical protein
MSKVLNLFVSAILGLALLGCSASPNKADSYPDDRLTSGSSKKSSPNMLTISNDVNKSNIISLKETSHFQALFQFFSTMP